MGTKITRWRWVLFVIAAIFLTIAVSYAKHVHLEKWYQNRWCSEQGGQAEVALPDGTRADCITEKNAVEFDFGKKWAEAIGQALYYSVQTGKRPGVVLILEDESDLKFWIRLNTTVEQYKLPLDTWKIDAWKTDAGSGK